jgi:hypothetical protein
MDFAISFCEWFLPSWFMADSTVLAHSLAGLALSFYIFHVNLIHSAMFRLFS